MRRRQDGRRHPVRTGAPESACHRSGPVHSSGRHQGARQSMPPMRRRIQGRDRPNARPEQSSRQGGHQYTVRATMASPVGMPAPGTGRTATARLRACRRDGRRAMGSPSAGPRGSATRRGGHRAHRAAPCRRGGAKVAAGRARGDPAGQGGAGLRPPRCPAAPPAAIRLRQAAAGRRGPTRMRRMRPDPHEADAAPSGPWGPGTGHG